MGSLATIKTCSILKVKSLPVITFLLVLSISLLLVFFLHTFLLSSNGMPKYGNLIVKSYIANGLLAASIYTGLYIFLTTLKNYIGFLFMGGSFLKFILFFVLFYPSYSADGEMDKIEFASFFVPYLIALILETFFMVKMLRKLD